jgi:pyruvate kinase
MSAFGLTPAVISKLTQNLLGLRTELESFVASFEDELSALDDETKASAQNLLHYVAFRRNDLRSLQEELSRVGLSSLGRAEAHVMANLDALLRVLSLLDETAQIAETPAPLVDFDGGSKLLETRAESLLGPPPRGSRVRIMVTMPSEAAEDSRLIEELVCGGMQVMRINCAHDGPESWREMIKNLKNACAETSKTCKIMMDLPGPKLRTGRLEPGPRVFKARPRRDELGRVLVPAELPLVLGELSNHQEAAKSGLVPLIGPNLSGLRVHDMLRFRDARGRPRRAEVTRLEPPFAWAELQRTAYVTTGMEMIIERPLEGEDGSASGGQRARELGRCWVGELLPREESLVLERGDRLVIVGPDRVGKKAVRGDDGEVVEAASIPCTLPQVFGFVGVGERVLFDDGKIPAVIRKVEPSSFAVEITGPSGARMRLRADKGINLPDTQLELPALTDADLALLDFIVEHSDLVAYSFVRTRSDLARLQAELAKRGGDKLGIVLKIETEMAFRELPSLLLQALRSRSVGVMIARGDLAVECGWERLAEVQEEILWMCQAAHMPVIWATQVLESLAKDGLPSRAEITDAAMAERAECVMLNKGPFILEALRVLTDIVERMAGHQAKKRSMLRKLKLAEGLKAPPSRAPG